MQDIGDIPSSYGRNAQTASTGFDLVGSIGSWLSNPFNDIMLILGILVVFVVFIVIFVPGGAAAVGVVANRAANAGRKKS